MVDWDKRPIRPHRYGQHLVKFLLTGAMRRDTWAVFERERLKAAMSRGYFLAIVLDVWAAQQGMSLDERFEQERSAWRQREDRSSA